MEASRSLCNSLPLMDIVRLDDDCVIPSDAPYGRPTYANTPLSELFVGPCIDRSKVLDKVHDYSVAPVVRVLCWGYVPLYASILDDRSAKLRGGEISSGLMPIIFLSLIFPSSSPSSSSPSFSS